MSVIIDSTPYFNGPLYANKIYSTNIISIINDSKYVGIITSNTSCKNLTTKNISFIGNIDISSNSTTINVPINYLTNINASVTYTSGEAPIIRNNNISNTLGYTFNVINEASTNTDAYFPFLAPYTTLPSSISISTVSNLTIGSIKVSTPGMYLVYIQMQIFNSNANNTIAYSLFNFNTDIQINGTTILQNTEMCNIQNYRQTTELSNAHYFYSKIIMCNVTSSNSVITMIYKPLVANIHSLEVSLDIDSTYNHNRFLRYNIIKIS